MKELKIDLIKSLFNEENRVIVHNSNYTEVNNVTAKELVETGLEKDTEYSIDDCRYIVFLKDDWTFSIDRTKI